MISSKEVKSQGVSKESIESLVKKKKISQLTYLRVMNAKKYIERKYNMKKIKNLQNVIINQKIQNSNLSTPQKEEIKNALVEKETLRLRKLREKYTIYDYEHISIIGKGAFGEVHLCKDKRTNQVVAIKKMKKELLLKKYQLNHIKDEQYFLSRISSPWIVNLNSSFQEGDFLYLVMEYLPGGDLMNLLMKKETLPEEQAKFYLCELILAIETVHQKNCIHRDVKPDNILIDKDGHIKISDFGLAKIPDNYFVEDIISIKQEGIQNKENINNNTNTKHKRHLSCVRTAYYVAPEVLRKEEYDKSIDWWSVGVIFYEMLYGYAPFFSRDAYEVCNMVLNYEKHLKFPRNPVISQKAKDLILQLITEPSKRLGKKGAEEIKLHSFFAGINWKKLRKTTPPFIPKLSSDFDTTYFEIYEETEDFYPPLFNKKKKDPEFIGYTFSRNEIENKDNLITAIELIKKKQEEMEYIKKQEENTQSSNSNENNKSTTV